MGMYYLFKILKKFLRRNHMLGGGLKSSEHEALMLFMMFLTRVSPELLLQIPPLDYS